MSDMKKPALDMGVFYAYKDLSGATKLKMFGCKVEDMEASDYATIRFSHSLNSDLVSIFKQHRDIRVFILACIEGKPPIELFSFDVPDMNIPMVDYTVTLPSFCDMEVPDYPRPVFDNQCPKLIINKSLIQDTISITFHTPKEFNGMAVIDRIRFFLREDYLR